MNYLQMCFLEGRRRRSGISAFLSRADISPVHEPLRRVNLNLEKLRVFWRLICEGLWISGQQMLFVSQRLDEIGRMIGGWLKTLLKD